jgi:hypothetical protein
LSSAVTDADNNPETRTALKYRVLRDIIIDVLGSE